MVRPLRFVSGCRVRFMQDAADAFQPLPHFAFSGRCFEREMKDLIYTDLTELIV